MAIAIAMMLKVSPPFAPRLPPVGYANDIGINFLDTGDFYGMGHNELLIREAIKGIPRDKVFIAVKFGALRDHKGGFNSEDSRPVAVQNFLAYSLQRLGVDYIDLYYPARVDPHVPIEDTIGAIADLIQDGKVRYAGLSEASADTLRRAAQVHPIAMLQTEYSLWTREPEADLLPTCRANNSKKVKVVQASLSTLMLLTHFLLTIAPRIVQRMLKMAGSVYRLGSKLKG
jgi:aryl-alcohol dehydrogenase-like predicted oxidoreductase